MLETGHCSVFFIYKEGFDQFKKMGYNNNLLVFLTTKKVLSDMIIANSLLAKGAFIARSYERDVKREDPVRQEELPLVVSPLTHLLVSVFGMMRLPAVSGAK